MRRKRRRNPVLTRDLSSVFLGRMDEAAPWKVHLTFRDTWGTADARGREVTAYLRLWELAEAARRAMPAVSTNDGKVLLEAERILRAAGGMEAS